MWAACEGAQVRGRWSGIVVGAALLAAACGPSEPDDAFARVEVLETSADWRERAVGEFISAADGQPLSVGDEVRTDETGFAEIEYVDGSLTRLDVETTFRVLDLGTEAVAPEIEVELETGRMWNRVREVTGTEGRFEVQTAVGVAAVRGTAFWIACDGQVCRISVTEGTVAFTLPDGTELLIEAGEGIAVGADGEQARGPIDPDIVAPEGWAGRNTALDDDTQRFGGGREACNASLAAQSLNRANTPDRAVVVDASDEDVPAIARSRRVVTSYDIDLRVGPLAVPAASGTVNPPDNGFRTTVDIASYAFVGVGLYEIQGSATGADCQLTAYVRVVGRNPLTTLLGALGVLFSVLGATGAFLSWRRTRRTARDPGLDPEGHRVLGGVSGAVGGFGVAVLLQQFAVLPLSTALLAAAPTIGLLVGLVAGWPRGGSDSTTPTDEQP